MTAPAADDLRGPLGRVYPSMGEAVAAAMDNNIRNAEAYRRVVADRARLAPPHTDPPEGQQA